MVKKCSHKFHFSCSLHFCPVMIMIHHVIRADIKCAQIHSGITHSGQDLHDLIRLEYTLNWGCTILEKLTLQTSLNYNATQLVLMHQTQSK